MICMKQMTVTWGEALELRLRRYPGGLVAAVRRIHSVLRPPLAESRPTYDKLRHVDGPEQLSETDRWRAFVLLLAIGEDPQEWGVAKPEHPAGLGDVVEEAFRRRPPSPPARENVSSGRVRLPRLDSNQKPAGYRPRAGQPLLVAA